MRSRIKLSALFAVLLLVIAACGGDGDGETTTTSADAGEETTTTVADGGTDAPAGDAVLACQITDVGGIDDKSFNQTAFKGITDAIEAGLATPDSGYLESQAATDYEPNINSSIERGCDVVITVGFLLSDATAAAAEANTEQKFAILDAAYDPPLDNVVGAVFETTDAAFLAGYLAAGATQTGVVATYGGIQIPCAVTCFMDGFVYGVRYYNEQNGTDVQTLGWNPEEQTGVFTGDFETLDNGRNVAQSFIDEGADIILPVAGPVGEGSAALAQEVGDVWIIGVDADWFQTLPQYADVTLTSVMKGLDVAVYEIIESVSDGSFAGGTRSFSIQEDGVGIGPINEAVDAALTDQIAEVEAGLKDGSIDPASMAN